MRNLLIVTLCVLSIFNLYSQELDINSLSEKEIFKIVDVGINDKDDSLISDIGSLDITSPKYNGLEEYLLQKIKILIENGDLVFSLKLVEALLYNNLENEETQNLYTIIVNKRIENDERLEAENNRPKIEREELSQTIDKEEFISDVIMNNKELINVIDGYTDSYSQSNYVTNFYFYPFTTKYYSSEVYDGYTSRDSTTNSFTGQGMDLGLGIDYGLFRFRSDFFINITYDDLLNETLKQVTGGTYLSIGLVRIDFPIFLRSGFIYDLYLYNNNDFSDVAITNLPSPTIGLGLTGLKLFKVLKLDVIGDILLAPIYTENLNTALLGKVYITLNLIRFSDQSLELKGGFDSLYLNEGGLVEYSITPRFGIGISSYE